MKRIPVYPSATAKIESKGNEVDQINNGLSVESNSTVDLCEHYTKSPIYNALSPFMLSLQIAGFYFVRYKDSTQTGRFALLWNLYSYFVLILIWSNLVVNLSSLKTIDGFNPGSFFLISSILLFGLGAADATCFIVAAHDRKAWAKFFECLARVKGCDVPAYVE